MKADEGLAVGREDEGDGRRRFRARLEHCQLNSIVIPIQNTYATAFKVTLV
jgi:hypothetical protein